MNRLVGTALVTAGLSLCAIASASAQATFKIDTSMIPPGIARELKRHGIEVPKEPVRGTIEIREASREGISVRFHETPKASGAGRPDRAGAGAATSSPPAAADAAPPPSGQPKRPAWVDTPPEISADRCSPASSASRTCSDAPVPAEARVASLPASAAPVPEFPASAPEPSAASGPMGEWLVADGSARIDIQPCGSNLCGTVTSANEKGRMGERILRDMKPDGANRWKGTILDPRSGKTYQSTMTLKGSSLRVEGCLMGYLCGGETWTRG